MHQPSRVWIEKNNFSEFCRPYGRPLAGQLANRLLKNFAFTIHFLQNWCADYLKNSERPYVKLLTRRNFDFLWKKEYFLIFYIFWSLQFFSGKIMLAGQWPANSWKNNWKMLVGQQPAISRPNAKKNFCKKIKIFKNFHEFWFFSLESFFSKNFSQFSIFKQFISSRMCI